MKKFSIKRRLSKWNEKCFIGKQNKFYCACWLHEVDCSKIVKEFENRIINIHPALLPKFGGAGMFGERVHEAVIVASEKESGATVHFVNEEYDRGLIILQDKVLISSDETKESLAKKF